MTANVDAMREAALKARRIIKRLPVDSLAFEEAMAMIALGRLEQFIQDTDAILSMEMTR